MTDGFSIDDIHRIRAANYEKIKGLSHVEIIEKTTKGAEPGWRKLEDLKKRHRAKENLG